LAGQLNDDSPQEQPKFPITIQFEDGSTEEYQSVKDLECNLEEFDSTKDNDCKVTDASGKEVELMLHLLKIRRLSFKR